MKKFSKLATINLFIILFSSCSSSDNPVADANLNHEVNVTINPFAISNNELGGNVYFQLTQGSNPKFKENTLISPYSLFSALSIAYAGANGQTAKEMAETMHLPGGVDAPIPELINWINLFQDLPNETFTLRSANAAWLANTITLVPSYQEVIAKSHESIKLVDYQQPEEARTEINDWVAEYTNEKILNLIPPGAITTNTRLTLVNALYLKADWLHPFKKEKSTQAPFIQIDNSSVSTDFMHQQERFSVLLGQTYDAIELPYMMGKDSKIQLALRVYLPHNINSLDDVSLDFLNNSPFIPATKSWSKRLVSLTLPKFKIESSMSLSEALQNIGMTTPFILGKADFSGIDGTKELAISDIIQKTFIEVDEKGTEAAAATALIMTRSAFMPLDEPPFEFKADHPFLFTLVDTNTETVLFMGRLTEVNPVHNSTKSQH